MKSIIQLSCLIAISVLVGCGSDAGTADVEGKPALKNPPPSKENNKSMSAGMQMDPTQMMLGRLDKNRDGVIEGDEIPDGGLDSYDYNKDGKVTKEEMQKRNDEISAKGLKGMESNPDEGKAVKK